MAKTIVLFGERLGKDGELRLGCSAVIFDELREKIMLTRRADNGQWCLPGGRVESGESVSEACIREVLEETGLQVKVTRLTGVYSNPNKLVIYPDGSKAHIIALNFEVELLGGEPGLSDETTAWGYFSLSEAATMELLAGHLERIQDTLAEKIAAFVK